MQEKSIHPYHEFYDQLAGDVAFFWLLRSAALKQVHIYPADLAELENRITTHFDALMTAPDEAWELCEAALEFDQEGEVFAAAVIAFTSLDPSKIQRVVEAGLASTQAFKGLSGALAWLPGSLCHSWIKKFLTSKDLNHKYLALAVCSLRREDPREYLTAILARGDCIAFKPLYVRALRLIGELKRSDLTGFLRPAKLSDEPDIHFWSNWSAILLGDKSVVHRLRLFTQNDNPYQQKAIDIVFRASPIEDARAWISQLAALPEQTRNVIKATAALGDPHAITWLIAQMRIPECSRLAGEAFTLITGLNLSEHNLALEKPINKNASILESDADEDVLDITEDESLPYPDADKIAALWLKIQQGFVAGQRYFMGQQLTSEHLLSIYTSGNQRQRRAAALELALLESDHYLWNYAARDLSE